MILNMGSDYYPLFSNVPPEWWWRNALITETRNLVSVPMSAIVYWSAREWFAYPKHFKKLPQFYGFHFLSIWFNIKVNCLSDFAYMIVSDQKAVI